MDKLRVLLVEDDAALSTLLALELRHRDFDVATAKTGERGIAKIGSEPYDIVVTDLKLGEVDGLTVLQKAKQEQPECEVILITGHGSIDTAVAAMRAGAFDYLTKPVQPEELAIVLNKALEHGKLIGEVDVQGPVSGGAEASASGVKGLNHRHQWGIRLSRVGASGPISGRTPGVWGGICWNW